MESEEEKIDNISNEDKEEETEINEGKIKFKLHSRNFILLHQIFNCWPLIVL